MMTLPPPTEAVILRRLQSNEAGLDYTNDRLAQVEKAVALLNQQFAEWKKNTEAKVRFRWWKR